MIDTSLLGTSIGHIRMIDVIGEGGMGHVYVGFDEVLKRKVAIKVIKGERKLDEQAKLRLIKEAQVLSQLNHPNICQIYDLIHEPDCDYLVLEFIQGRALQHLSREELSFHDKLAIARQLTDVLVVTHSKGIVHRDLKPDNVMLTENGQVKVLDFGLSRTTTDQESETLTLDDFPVETDTSLTPELSAVLKTRLGAVFGTPRYMSPEQARGEPATAASDMYALGLVLQELFSGKRAYPADLASEALLWKAMNGDTLPMEGDGDLERMINRLKARAWDIRPTAVETQARLEWIRLAPRRRVKRIAVVSFIALLILGIAGTSIGFSRAKSSEHRARTEADNATQTVVLLREFLSSVDPREQGKDVKVRELLEAFRPKLDRLEGNAAIQTSLYSTYAATYTGLGLYDEAATYSEKAFTLSKAEFGPEHPTTLQAWDALGWSCANRGKFTEAEQIHRSCWQIQKRVLGDKHPDTLSTESSLAADLHLLGLYDEAEQVFRNCLDGRRQVLGDENRSTLITMTNLASLLSDSGKYEESERLHRQCLEIRTRKIGTNHPDSLDTLSNLAKTLFYQGKFAECEEAFRTCAAGRKAVQGEEHPKTLGTLNNLGAVLTRQGKLEEAEEIHRSALETKIRVLGKEHPDTLYSQSNLAGTLHAQGLYDEVEDISREILRVRKKTLGDEHPETLLSLNNLGTTLSSQNEHEEAEKIHRQCLAIRTRVLGPEHPDTLLSLFNLSDSLLQLERFDEAVQLQQQCIDQRTRILGPSHPDTLKSLHSLALIEHMRGNSSRAIEVLIQAINQGSDPGELVKHPQLKVIPGIEEIVAQK